MNILEINNLVKDFGQTRALDNVSLTVPEGSICGLLGPNGAGKTTLLRIINSIIIPDSGTVKIDGNDVNLESSRLLGYMPEERGLYDKMRIEDQIMYFGMLRGGNPKRLREVMDEYLALFQLDKMKRKRVKELSKGNQQKVQIIATMVHEPKIVILDEPFSGFDPINGAILQQLIARLHEKGTTVMLSSHNMPAIEEMCSDIILIDHGHVLLQGKLDDIKENNRRDTILFTTRLPISGQFLMDSGMITEIIQVETKDWRKGTAYRLHKTPNVVNADLIAAIALQGDIIHFEEELPTLNDIFIRYTSNII